MNDRQTKIVDGVTKAQLLLCQVKKNHLWDDSYKTTNLEDVGKLSEIKAIIQEVEMILNVASVEQEKICPTCKGQKQWKRLNGLIILCPHCQ